MEVTVVDDTLSYKLTKPIDLSDAMRKIAELLIENAQDNAPVDTGELKEHIDLVDLGATYVEIASTSPYSRYVEYGTGLYTSKQTFAHSIPWSYQDEQGNWHTTSGEHPHPFLTKALQEKKEEIKKILGEAIIDKL